MANRWQQQQSKDPFVKKRNQEGYRSRASFKLLDVIQKHQFIQNGQTVIELGSSPGGWSQVLARFNRKGINIALDLLPMDPIDGVRFFQGDFLESAMQEQIMKIAGDQIDCVISDMAINLSGDMTTDQYKSVALWEEVLDFCERCLSPKGCLLIKVFHGVGFDAFLGQMRGAFKKCISLKPPASKKRSRESYLLGVGFRV